MKTVFTVMMFCISVSLLAQQKVEFVIEKGKVKSKNEKVISLNPNEEVTISVSNTANTEFGFLIQDKTSIVKRTQKDFERNQQLKSKDQKIELLKFDGDIKFSFLKGVDGEFTINFSTKPIETPPEASGNKLKETPPEQYSSGYIYYDAVKLLTPDKDSKKVIEFYAVKFPSSKDSIDTTSNKYLGRYLKNNWENFPKSAVVVTQSKVGKTQSSISKGISSLGGLDVTALSDGLAKFLVKRTKRRIEYCIL